MVHDHTVEIQPYDGGHHLLPCGGNCVADGIAGLAAILCAKTQLGLPP